MKLNATTAAHFYDTARAAMSRGPEAETKPTAAGQASEALVSFAETLQTGEQTAKDALTGGADLPTLVEALARSELAVETAVAVRDRVVEAYQEILRMPV